MRFSRIKIGANIKMDKLITKVIPRLEYHAGMTNGASKEKHQGKNDILRGSG